MMGTMLDYDNASLYLPRGQWGSLSSDWRLWRHQSLDQGAVEHALKWFIRQASDRLYHGLLFLE